MPSVWHLDWLDLIILSGELSSPQITNWNDIIDCKVWVKESDIRTLNKWFLCEMLQKPWCVVSSFMSTKMEFSLLFFLFFFTASIFDKVTTFFWCFKYFIVFHYTERKGLLCISNFLNFLSNVQLVFSKVQICFWCQSRYLIIHI